jgi:hypothetical protein
MPFPISNEPDQNMKNNTSYLPVRDFLVSSLILVITGLGGLFAVINLTEPSGGTRWAFFFCSVLGLSGLALPGIAFLNAYFGSTPPPNQAVIMRQAIWLGIYLPSLAWLRIGRVLDLSLAFLLAAGLILIEWLLRLRERSQWKPD